MTPEQVEEKVIELIHREPFVPFVVEMKDGESLKIMHPRLAINGGGAGFIGPDGGLVDFWFKTVRSIIVPNAETVARRLGNSKRLTVPFVGVAHFSFPEEDRIMTPEQVEEKVIELIHREPFVPFVVQMQDGESLEILHPRLAINGGGAGFFGPDGGLVDFEFKTVRAIIVPNSEAVA